MTSTDRPNDQRRGRHRRSQGYFVVLVVLLYLPLAILFLFSINDNTIPRLSPLRD